MATRAEKRQAFIDAILATGKTQVTTDDIRDIVEQTGLKWPQWFTKDESYRIKRGVFRVPGVSSEAPEPINMVAQVIPMAKPAAPVAGNRIANVTTDLEVENLIPTQYKNYVPFGNFEDVLSIVQSSQFFPVFITGQSCNGITMSIELACD